MRIHVFRAGTHTASNGRTITFSEADLRDIAEVYNPALHEAPLVIGHPKTDDPAYGWVKRVDYVEGEGLYVEAHQVEPAFEELVRRGRYKKISISLYLPDAPDNPVPGHYYLRHVGFLGAQAPAVKGLRPVELNEAAGAVTITFGEEEPATVRAIAEAVFERLRRWLGFAEEELSTRPWEPIDPSDYESAEAYCAACLIDMNEPGQPKVKEKCKLPIREPNGRLNRNALFAAQNSLVNPARMVKAPPEVRRAAARKLVRIMREHGIEPAESLLEVADMAEPQKQTQPEQQPQGQQTVDVEKLRAELEQRLRTEFEERQRRREQIVEFVGGLLEQGKITPAYKPFLVAFMERLSEIEGTISFAEKEQSLLEAFQGFLQALPRQVHYGEFVPPEEGEAQADVPVPPGYRVRPEKLELHRKALQYAEQHKVDYVTAIKRVSAS